MYTGGKLRAWLYGSQARFRRGMADFDRYIYECIFSRMGTLIFAKSVCGDSRPPASRSKTFA